MYEIPYFLLPFFVHPLTTKDYGLFRVREKANVCERERKVVGKVGLNRNVTVFSQVATSVALLPRCRERIFHPVRQIL